MLFFVKLCCCADFLFNTDAVYRHFYDALPHNLRYVNSTLFARRISACLHSALYLITSSIQAGSSLQRVSPFNATSKRVAELYKGRQCISTLLWSLGRIHSLRYYASSGCGT